MGWWGHDVLSGDPALDMLGTLTDLIGLDHDQVPLYPDGVLSDPQTRARICRWVTDQGHGGLTAAVRAASGWRSDDELAAEADWLTDQEPDVDPSELHTAIQASRTEDEQLAWQVLAVLTMAAGAALPPQTHTRMVGAGTHDVWAQHDPARQAAMDRYLATLARYDGTPSAVRSATLGDAFDRAVEVGHTGLLNVDPDHRR